MRAVVLVLAVSTTQCTKSELPASPQTGVSLRIGLPDVGASDAFNGARQLIQSFATEGLAKIGIDGRPTPALAEGWTIAADGLSMRIRLRPGIKFQDGSPVIPATVVTALQRELPQFMGPAFDDIEHMAPLGDREIEIRFRRPSPPFVLEALEVPIQTSGSPAVGTGPYMAAGPGKPNEIRSNPNYYLGPPTIDHIVVSSYPNVRSAWADMLRNRIDVLYEVGFDALDSLTSAKNVAVFTHVRNSQYVLAFNTASGPLRSSEIRQALVAAIEPDAFIQDAFNGRAARSSGPISPKHWAFPADAAEPRFNPTAAAAKLAVTGNKLRFTALVRPDLERVGLVVKRQLEAVGVEMTMQEASLTDIFQAIAQHKFDAVILEVISGPSIFRPYEMWHSKGVLNPGGFGNAVIDSAFDKIRYSRNDDEYRAAVKNLQETVVRDPPAIFLAWGERARAVNRRFDVAAEPGRDILPTLRLWRTIDDVQFVGRN